MASFDFRWPTILINFFNYLRNTFAFMSLTLFRPECEIDIPYIYRWIFRITMPLLLVCGAREVDCACGVRGV